MKRWIGVFLIISILSGMNHISYAADIEGNAAENTEIVDGIDAEGTTENVYTENTDIEATEDEVNFFEDSETLLEENEYIIQGTGKGITDETEVSLSDTFAELTNETIISAISNNKKRSIEQFYSSNGSKEVFGNALNSGFQTNTGVAYIDYEWATIITSEYGVFAVETPLLNVYISSGGVQVLGAPVAEDYVEDGYIWQEFENGTLSCEMEKSNDTLCVRRGNMYYFKCNMEGGEADYAVCYGKSTDTALIGDWDGDGIDTLCVRRGNNYYFKNDFSGGEAEYVVCYGKITDSTCVGDWDGDGIDTLCVRRGRDYYFKNDFGGGKADYVLCYGKRTDGIYVGDWNGDGIDTLCVRRGRDYYFKNDFSGGKADYVVCYGKTSDSTRVGDWDGDGIDTLCVRRGRDYYFKNGFSGGKADYTVRYGKTSDSVYVGTWKKRVERVDECESTQILFNMSRNYSYSQLTMAFAGNSVNSTSFRKSALTTFVNGDGDEIQYCAYYDCYGTVVLAKRINSGTWTYRWTSMKGTITDAHNVISIAVDGLGYLHVALSVHSGELSYAKSIEPGSLELETCTMLGQLEDKVTYPEFQVLPSGDLFFLYRNGQSGNGNLVLNKYFASTGEWIRVHDNLISGEETKSPYWQSAVDSRGRLHISWVWRETSNVSTNYNLSYVVSTDDSGSAFVNSKEEELRLPIVEENAELIQEIPQNSSLINQTSMTVDDDDYPYIVSYWRENGVVQYHVIRYTGEQWIVYNTDIRNTDFVLGGTGTRQLPCARPQILVDGSGENANIYIIFRDSERLSYASLATFSINETELITESMIDLTNSSLEEWEPNYDIELWKKKRRINIFMQKEYFTYDGSAEKYWLENVYVLDVTSEKK